MMQIGYNRSLPVFAVSPHTTEDLWHMPYRLPFCVKKSVYITLS